MALRMSLNRIGSSAFNSILRGSRPFSLTNRALSQIVNIQDTKDFDTQVKQSKDLIIVDFHAEFVLNTLFICPAYVKCNFLHIEYVVFI